MGNGTIIEVRMFESEKALAEGDKAKSKILGTTDTPSTLLRLSYTKPSRQIGFYLDEKLVDFDTAWFGMGCYFQNDNGFLRDYHHNLVFADPV